MLWAVRGNVDAVTDDASSRQISWWQLQLDVAWGRGLLAVATIRADVASVRPELPLFLGDRYWRLAHRHFVHGRRKAAERLVRKARRYFRIGGGPEPPPLAAGVMPIPPAPSLTAAIAGSRRAGGPPDAA